MYLPQKRRVMLETEATDLLHGHPVLFDRGLLSDASIRSPCHSGVPPEWWVAHLGQPKI
jgi:hypothetical protein